MTKVTVDTSIIRDDSQQILADTGALREDMGQLHLYEEDILAELTSLKGRLPARSDRQISGSDVILQRFLEQSTAYAESLVDEESVSNYYGHLGLASDTEAVDYLALGPQSSTKYWPVNAGDDRLLSDMPHTTESGPLTVPPPSSASSAIPVEKKMEVDPERSSTATIQSILTADIAYCYRKHVSKVSKSERRKISLALLNDALQAGAKVNYPVNIPWSPAEIEDFNVESSTEIIGTLSADSMSPNSYSFRPGRQKIIPGPELITTSALIASIWIWKEDSVEHLQLLIDFHADVESPDIALGTALIVAVMCDAHKSIEVLIAAGANTDTIWQHPGMVTSTVASLSSDDSWKSKPNATIFSGPFITTQRATCQTAVLEAVARDQVALVRLLLLNGADVNFANERVPSPLHLASTLR